MTNNTSKIDTPNGYIYIRDNKLYIIEGVYKLGKASNIPDRDSVYATSELNRGEFVMVIEVPIKLMGIIENYLQYEFKRLGLHIQKDGGTEFFKREIINLIIPYLQELNTIFKVLSKIEISKLVRMNRIRQLKIAINRSGFIQKLKNRKILNQQLIVNNSLNVEPNQHQQEVLDKIYEYYSKYDIGKIIWACGLGKALLCVFIAKLMNCKTVVIGVPSNYLQKQMELDILKIYPNKKNIMYIGGDDAKTTKEILTFIENPTDECKFIITTYHSCYLIVNQNIKIDFKIGDEAHHLVGVENENENENERSFKSFHKIQSTKTLFMTATEKIVENYIEKTVYSMDDEKIFGKCIDNKTVCWAIEKRKITDYNVLMLKNTEDEVDSIIKNLKLNVCNKELFISAYMTLKSIINRNNLSHILIYTNKIKDAELVNTYIDYIVDSGILPIKKNDLYNKVLHSGSSGNLSSEVKTFENSKYGIISCVYLFGEGFNLPKLNGVCIASNMNSEIRIIQYLLRPNRLENGNPDKIAYIIIPRIEYDDFELEKTSSSKLNDIIHHLSNVDENIEQKIICLTNKKIIKRDNEDKDEEDIHNCFELEENQEALENLKIRCRFSKSLRSGLKPEQDEFNHYKSLNQIRGIQSKEEYISRKYSEYMDNPEEHFKTNGVWTNWYDFLGVDKTKFIQNLQEWKRFCKEKKISSVDYINFCEIYEQLPKNPAEFYIDFTSISGQLGENAIIRR